MCKKSNLGEKVNNRPRFWANRGCHRKLQRASACVVGVDAVLSTQQYHDTDNGTHKRKHKHMHKTEPYKHKCTQARTHPRTPCTRAPTYHAHAPRHTPPPTHTHTHTLNRHTTRTHQHTNRHRRAERRGRCKMFGPSASSTASSGGRQALFQSPNFRLALFARIMFSDKQTV